jgi:hypothetical protein
MMVKIKAEMETSQEQMMVKMKAETESNQEDMMVKMKDGSRHMMEDSSLSWLSDSVQCSAVQLWRVNQQAMEAEDSLLGNV